MGILVAMGFTISMWLSTKSIKIYTLKLIRLKISTVPCSNSLAMTHNSSPNWLRKALFMKISLNKQAKSTTKDKTKCQDHRLNTMTESHRETPH